VSSKDHSEIQRPFQANNDCYKTKNFTVISVSQTIFGIFPISGFWHANSDRLSFTFTSFAFLYSMAIQLSIAFMFSTSVYKQLNSKIVYTKVGKYHRHHSPISLIKSSHLQSSSCSSSSTFWSTRTSPLWRESGRST
jgi:hypothetical protein